MMIRGERIRELRQALKMSQEELADRAQTDQNRISVYENGHSDAKCSSLVLLANALHTSADYLLGMSNDPSPNVCAHNLSHLERKALLAWRRGDLLEATRIIVNGNAL